MPALVAGIHVFRIADQADVASLHPGYGCCAIEMAVLLDEKRKPALPRGYRWKQKEYVYREWQGEP
jgi:hypothetical protein